MPNKIAESSQPLVQQQQQQQTQQQQQQHDEAGGLPPPPQPGLAETRSRGSNTIFKSGPLFISSKGIGWTSWKKRWFILTRTSLVFFRSDPSAVPQKGSEVNLTLGGIDLNNSGSVVVKADKKLLTVLFPDGRDGRAFTLKAETMEDLHEWKAALENALTQAPAASHVMGQNGILRNDNGDTINGSQEKTEDKTPAKSAVIGTPILLALEDVDGAPSFLEKALKFIEEHGVKVEGILRQAAAVDDVEHRIQEFERGKNEFSPGEDAHVIADCVKYVLRELPSSPVPASCCNALLEACRTDRNNRVNAMRAAICETFPEPNRRLMQRILMMMQVVASHKNINRMSTSAVAACMAPLLLRPLLAGDCEIENDFDVGGDGSIQLLQAAAAANHAQAIIITLLEDYETIFGEGSLSADLYSDSEESGSETEEATDDEEYEDDENDDATEGSYDYTDDEDVENASNGSRTDSASSADNDSDDHETPDDLSTESKSPEENSDPEVTKKNLSSSSRSSQSHRDDTEKNGNISTEGGNGKDMTAMEDSSANRDNKLATSSQEPSVLKSSTLSNRPGGSKRSWGRTPGRKNLSMESIDFSFEEEDVEIERLESTKLELQNRISEEVKNNTVLQASLEQRKQTLYDRRLALEKDVESLQEQLQKERDKRAALEAGLNMSKGNLYIPTTVDEEVKRDLKEIAEAETEISKLEQKVENLEDQLNQQEGKGYSSTHRSSSERQQTSERHAKSKDKHKDRGAAATHVSERPTHKDAHRGAGENEIDKQQDSSSSQSKTSQVNQSHDISRTDSKLSGNSAKKSGAWGEGTTSTISALSKLTTRLNFLKERRSQIASELQNMDKGRNSSSNSDKGCVPETQEPEKGWIPDSESSSSISNQDSDSHVLDRGQPENSG